MRRPERDAHEQVKIKCACVSQIKYAHAQTNLRCARADQNEMRMRSSKKGSHVQEKMRCT